MPRAAHELVDIAQRGYRFALSLTGDVARAEDLLQDSWFNVLKADGPWDVGYLFATIRNRFIDLHRRDGRWDTVPLDHATDTPDDATDVPDDMSPEFWNGKNLMLGDGLMEAALEKLRPEERAVLYLAAVEEYSARKIGELLEWPRGTVLSLLHRAREKLRRTVGTDGKTP
ncbi:MAG: RNA polymerase sigma factor [Planctomycetes bacterium]|nr:RNA polymerase sigma factor [Planctomycetota bacterium]